GADHRLLADADVDEAVAQAGGEVTDGGAVLGRHDHDVRVLFGVFPQRAFVVHRTHRTISVSEVRVAAAVPWSSERSISISARVKFENHRSARRSMLGSPFPRTVRATTAVGFVAS